LQKLLRREELADAVAAPARPVCAYNEWDPLEEVVVGVVDGAAVPSWHPALAATMPEDQRSLFERHGGRPFPPERVAAARRELEEFVHVLEAEGVTVQRPEPLDFARPYATPEWESAGGLYAAMPRDLLMVVGDEILEAPMAWRSRYFEVHAFRPLIKEYFRRGARWTAAPRPQLSDALYRQGPSISISIARSLGWRCWQSCSTPSAPPVVAATAAKQKDQQDDQNDQTAVAHGSCLPFVTTSIVVLPHPSEKRSFYPDLPRFSRVESALPGGAPGGLDSRRVAEYFETRSRWDAPRSASRRWVWKENPPCPFGLESAGSWPHCPPRRLSVSR
jgi:hypothetical protein